MTLSDKRIMEDHSRIVLPAAFKTLTPPRYVYRADAAKAPKNG